MHTQIARDTLLHCGRCNQQIQTGEEYAPSRTHGVRIATHVRCGHPSTWTQCAKLNNETNVQCPRSPVNGSGYCDEHMETIFTYVRPVVARERVKCSSCGGFLFREAGSTRDSCRDCLHLGYGNVE